MKPSERIIAVVGTPNTGKSTLFNALTGLNQRVGNFFGVTVEPMVGSLHDDTRRVMLLDLPGIYSLTPNSEDERLTVDVLRGQHASVPNPDAILVVLNGSDPARCLALLAEIATLGKPVVVAATMVDEVKAAGGVFDDIALHHILKVPVVAVVGTKGLGLGDLRDVLLDPTSAAAPRIPPDTETPEDTRTWGVRTADAIVSRLGRDARTERIDRVVLHPVWGGLVFLAIMLLFFQSIFTWAEPLMSLLEGAVAHLQDSIGATLPEGVFKSFVVKGLFGGVGSVVVFLPQIIILNILVTILEESGYMARAAFLVDRVMGIFGLQGRSFIPLLGSFACAIPGIMSARIIPSYKDRMATILATPLMTCSARLPVYALLIGAVIPASTVAGIFSLQGMVLAGLYALGALSGLLVALVLKRTMFRGGTATFLMEFPPYRFPSLRSLSASIVNRSKDFLKTAGTIILVFSIGLWVLTELPVADIPTGVSAVQAERLQLEQSYAASLGKAVQPVFAPLGFDWQITLGILGSYAARETFVGVMGQIYAADVTESDAPLRTVLAKSIPFSTGLAILAFYVFALQCVSTMAIMKRETGSWRWPTLAFVITFVLAWGSAWFVQLVARPL